MTTRGEFAYWDTFQHIFKKNNTELVFLVRGGREQHRRFREEFKIRPRILIDEDGSVGERLEIYGPHEQRPDGGYHYYMAPAVFLVDSKGNLSCYWLLSGPRGRPSPEALLGILSLAQHSEWTY
jgi:peroxiredoxin